MKKYLIFAFCLSVISCKSSTESTNTQPSVIMPLALDNEWAYIDAQGSGGISIRIYDTLKFLQKFVYGQDTIYVSPEQTYYTNRSDGLWIKNYGSSNTLLAKYPAKPGDIFGYDSFVLTSQTSPDPIDTGYANIVVDSINANVTVPAGNYTCYKYNADYYDSKHLLLYRQNAYYAVNVGLIKRESFSLDSASKQLKLNDSYQLTKALLH